QNAFLLVNKRNEVTSLTFADDRRGSRRQAAHRRVAAGCASKICGDRVTAGGAPLPPVVGALLAAPIGRRPITGTGEWLWPWRATGAASSAPTNRCTQNLDAHPRAFGAIVGGKPLR